MGGDRYVYGLHGDDVFTHVYVASVMSDSLDCSPPGSSVHGILQARILEWVAVPSSQGSSRPRDRTHISYVSCIGRWEAPPGKFLTDVYLSPNSCTALSMSIIPQQSNLKGFKCKKEHISHPSWQDSLKLNITQIFLMSKNGIYNEFLNHCHLN